MMTPSGEYRELLVHSRRLIDAALLLVITFALLIVAAATLLCTVFVTVFSMGRNGLNRWTEKVTVGKGETFREPLRT